ncbi:transposable element Tcb2 transposase [Hylaeus anthracinus]|uniref:transposable element Tcb2 transposase n=1 Tax=Hylaeus anthracinus TaxID=313031 RepID=UPI0023BA2D83|nr:transposable element Tcb2 transposase [Hylaeus anthracinus]
MYCDQPKSGRLRETTPKMDRQIHRLSEKDRFRSANNIAAEINYKNDTQISVRTVRKRLGDFNLRGRKPPKKPLLSSRNQKRRLAFAKAHKHWTSEDWQKVLFSDESKFIRVCSDGIRYVRRRIGESLKTRCVLKTLKHGGGNVVVWACFSRSGPGPICRINGIVDRFQYMDILKNIMLPFARNNMSDDFIFQNDNNPKHTAQVVKQFFQEENITVLPCPSQSPDINPIENLWSIIKTTVPGYKPKNLNELYSTIETAWSNITVDQFPPDRSEQEDNPADDRQTSQMHRVLLDSTNQLTNLRNISVDHVPPVDFSEPAILNTEAALSSDILDIFGKRICEERVFAPPVHKDLVVRYEDVIKEGLSEEIRVEVLKKYPSPNNCTSIDPPKLNPEFKFVVQELVSKRDDRIRKKQEKITVSLGLALASNVYCCEGERQS